MIVKGGKRNSNSRAVIYVPLPFARIVATTSDKLVGRKVVVMSLGELLL